MLTVSLSFLDVYGVILSISTSTLSTNLKVLSQREKVFCHNFRKKIVFKCEFFLQRNCWHNIMIKRDDVNRNKDKMRDRQMEKGKRETQEEGENEKRQT
jgi:hypothetical protein